MALAPWIRDAEAAQADLVARARARVADAVLASARRLGASYADVRVSRYRVESIATREQQVQNVSRTQTTGFGVRVLVNGNVGICGESDADCGGGAAGHSGCGRDRARERSFAAEKDRAGARCDNRNELEERI